jgi:VWFA-related protein
MRTPIRVAILAVVTAALHVHAQTPVPQATFRGGTDLVQIDVSVLDDRRRPVRGLRAEDFTVLENGQRREIQAFSEVYLPDRVQSPEGSWTREVPSDVATNQVGQQEGRLVVILLDRTIPVEEPTVAARRIATAVINQLGPDDLAAVVSTSNGAVQNLTADRARLLRAISASDLSTGISAEAREIEEGIFASTGRVWSTLNDGRCQCGLCVLETITRVADAVQTTSRRRKVLFFIGSDLLLQTADSAGGASNDVGCEKRLNDARQAMFTAVDRANLTIHSLDPVGLANVNPATKASSMLRAGAVPGAVARTTEEHLRRLGNLEVMPDRTGGRAVMNTNGPDLAVPDIFRESDSYYLIGIRPADSGGSGKFHPLTVKTTRRGLHLRARSGYTSAPPREHDAAPATGAPLTEPVSNALTGLLPDSATALDMNAAAFAVPGTARAAVVLTVGARGFASERSGDAATRASSPFEIVATALDPRGRATGIARHAVELPSTQPGATTAPRVEGLSRLDLPPGEYEMRVALSGNGRTASVFSYLTVPPFATAPLSLSNLVLAAGPQTTTAPQDFLAPLLPVVPTAQREFARTDRLLAFFRIYQGTTRKEPLATAQLQSALVDARGTVVAAETRALDAGQFAKDRTSDQYLSAPIASLAPGDYLLKVQVTIGARVAGRAVRFTVTN